MIQAFFDDSTPGRRRLATVFWRDGVLISHLLFAALLATYGYLPAPAFAAFVVLFLCYTAWIMRSIWLNAGNVDRAEWGSMARVLTIGWTINAVVVCLFLTLAKWDNQPLQFWG
jgi:hypothetical protein